MAMFCLTLRASLTDVSPGESDSKWMGRHGFECSYSNQMKHPFLQKRCLWSPGIPFSRASHRPQSLDIELTQRCNNACIHCFINLPERDLKALKSELSTETWKSILSEAADLGVLDIRFTGGEPLLRPDFADLYLHARRLGLMVSLATNGRLLTPELGDLFHSIPPLGAIEISVYGLTATSYEKVSLVQGSFAEMMQGIDVLKRYRIPFSLNFSLLPPTMTEEHRIATWEKKVAGRKRAAHPVPVINDLLHLRVNRDSKTKNRAIARMRLVPSHILSLLDKDPRFPQDFLDYLPRLLRRVRPSSPFVCGLACNGSIDSRGMFQPCLLLRHPDFRRSVLDTSLKEIASTVTKHATKKRVWSSAFRSTCGRCFFYGFCEQCPGHAWVEHGTLDTPVQYLCELMHVIARRLGLLAPGEKAWEVTDWEQRLRRPTGANPRVEDVE